MADKGREDARIPGDPGTCSECGQRLKVGVPHQCDDERARPSGSSSTVSAGFAVIREALERGRRDSELLDGRYLNAAFWDAKEAALARLEARQEAMGKALSEYREAAEVMASYMRIGTKRPRRFLLSVCLGLPHVKKEPMAEPLEPATLDDLTQPRWLTYQEIACDLTQTRAAYQAALESSALDLRALLAELATLRDERGAAIRHAHWAETVPIGDLQETLIRERERTEAAEGEVAKLLTLITEVVDGLERAACQDVTARFAKLLRAALPSPEPRCASHGHTPLSADPCPKCASPSVSEQPRTGRP